MEDDLPKGPLRRGWTTGACAAAAAKAALIGWRTGDFPDPVTIRLPAGETPAFALAVTERFDGGARVGIVKDAGDDPDVTHGATVLVTLEAGATGEGISYHAGPGVGTVTRPGLPLPVGEPAINPMPRQMIREALSNAIADVGGADDIRVTISIPGGEEIAKRTLNGRLGIVGGLSVLGTTGIVIPFSCAAWIHSIHRGIDVARASGIRHIAGSTGSTSEQAVQRLHDLPDAGLIEMGDFVGGMLKYLKKHPVPRLTIAGGFAKMVKLGQGMMDLHSRAGPVDLQWLAARAVEAGASAELASAIGQANTALDALTLAEAAALKLGGIVADHALNTAAKLAGGGADEIEIAVFDRAGQLLHSTGFRRPG